MTWGWWYCQWPRRCCDVSCIFCSIDVVLLMEAELSWNNLAVLSLKGCLLVDCWVRTVDI